MSPNLVSHTLPQNAITTQKMSQTCHTFPQNSAKHHKVPQNATKIKQITTLWLQLAIP